jgi:hypothetical protein
MGAQAAGLLGADQIDELEQALIVVSLDELQRATYL